MELFNSRGLNLLLIFTLVVSLFCFRDLFLPAGGNDEQQHLASSSTLPKPTEQSPEQQKLAYDTNPPPALPRPTTSHSTSSLSSSTLLSSFSTPSPGHKETTTNEIPMQNDCRHLPGADKVMVMLKTGATEIYSKLPTHLLTTFTCIPNFKIYSDLNQTFAGTPIHDVIAPVSQSFRDHHEDFKLYHSLLKFSREGQDMSKLKGETGWNLDKWKFLPMLHHAYESAGPEIEWFVMIEADTALSWLNLLPWLQTMDPSQPHYLGSQNLLGDTRFAHGGSGIVISRGAMDTLEGARATIGKTLYDEKWEQATAMSCCGDAVLAEALKAVDIPLTGAWPIIQGETISTLDFLSEYWCTAPSTWHHVSPIQVDAHWQFQTEWTEKHGWEKPFLYRDVFEHFVAPHVGVNRTKWNNLSRDFKYTSPLLLTTTDGDFTENLGGSFEELQLFERRSIESEELCAEACLLKGQECMQWMWSPGRCHLGRYLRLGASEVEGEGWNCGWMQERVEGLRRECP